MTTQMVDPIVGADPIRHNPYRTLGLPGEAAWSEIRTTAERLLASPEPGDHTTPWDLPWLGGLARTPASIERALRRLADPRQRLADRLLWFYERVSEMAVQELMPATIRNAIEGWSATSQPLARHDGAFVATLGALALDPEVEDRSLWERAFREWNDALYMERYWMEVLRLETGGGFETPASLFDVRETRNSGPALVATPLLVVAHRAVAEGSLARAARSLEVLREALLDDLFEELCGGLASVVSGALDVSWDPSPARRREPAPERSEPGTSEPEPAPRPESAPEPEPIPQHDPAVADAASIPQHDPAVVEPEPIPQPEPAAADREPIPQHDPVVSDPESSDTALDSGRSKEPFGPPAPESVVLEVQNVSLWDVPEESDAVPDEAAAPPIEAEEEAGEPEPVVEARPSGTDLEVPDSDLHEPEAVPAEEPDLVEEELDEPEATPAAEPDAPRPGVGSRVSGAVRRGLRENATRFAIVPRTVADAASAISRAAPVSRAAIVAAVVGLAGAGTVVGLIGATFRGNPDLDGGAGVTGARPIVEEAIPTGGSLAKAIADRVLLEQEVAIVQDAIDGYQILVDDYERRIESRLSVDRLAYRRILGLRNTMAARRDSLLVEQDRLGERIDRLSGIATESRAAASP